MKKIAIFVEGQTEMIFVTDLLVSIAGANNIALSVERYFSKTFIPLTSDPYRDQTYFALVVNCGSDNSVATAILDRHAGLTTSDYSLILGIRDLHPIADDEYDKLRAALAGLLPNHGARTSMIVARREVEAWFAQEETHYQKIDPAITPDAIRAKTGFDVENDCAETLAHPSDFLHNAYQIGGRAYRKRRNQVQRTVIALDKDRIVNNLPEKLPSLKLFTDELSAFFA